MTWKKIVFSNMVIHRKHDGNHVECHGQNCSKTLKAGDECYSHHTNSQATVYYCLPCYEALWL
ncbi:MAG: hypothetical protein OEX10_00505 [Candidatus Bathyarchaeota archaeon]|nr:hypothetical protein [Candidatus Bathyarchaeota archaeon]MDH5663357.1 hypothetical protein [Candidatus Bathyarchaeota archaeon]